MTKTGKKKWIKALLSGVYTQVACGMEVDEHGRCCVLGVGIAEGVIKDDYNSEPNLTAKQKWWLVQMNDGFRDKKLDNVPTKSFKELAAYIERYILKEKA